MKQALLYSINAEHLANILNGRKTIEVRKRDLPQWAKDKLAKGEIVEGYMYCTKGKPILSNYYNSIGGNYTLHSDYSEHFLGSKETQSPYILNGLVVVKFEVLYNEEIKLYKVDKSTEYYEIELSTISMCGDELCEKACITYEQLEDYLNEAKGYAHHITNIQPVNMELGEFEVWYGGEESFYPLKRAPQSFQTVWVKS